MKLRSLHRWLVGAALLGPAALPSLAQPGHEYEKCPAPKVNPIPAPPHGGMMHVPAASGDVIPVSEQTAPVSGLPYTPEDVTGLPPTSEGHVVGVPTPEVHMVGCSGPACGKRSKWSVWNCFCQGPGCDKCAVVPRGAQPAPNGYYLHQWMGQQAGKAEADDFVLYNHMWYMGGTQLGPLGRYQLDLIAKRLNREPFPVVIATSKDPALDQNRRETVIALLAQWGHVDPTRVIVAFPAAEGLYGEESFRIYNGLLRVGGFGMGGMMGGGMMGGGMMGGMGVGGFGYGGFGYLPYGGFGTFGRLGF